jgi:primosomal protein N' (replication factor Y)
MPAAQQPHTADRPFVEVALPLPVRQSFTYRLPERFAVAKLGARVLVPFGKRTLTGYAVGFPSRLDPDSELNDVAIKVVLELIDDEPLITDEILELTRWSADYYAASWGEMLKASLPAGINAAVDQIFSITSKGRLELTKEASAKSKRVQLLSQLASDGDGDLNTLSSEFGGTSAKRIIRELAKEGLIAIRYETAAPTVKAKRRKAVRLIVEPPEGTSLTEPQRRIIDALRRAKSIGFTDLLEKADVGASPINTLAKRGIVEVFVQEVTRDPLAGAELPKILDLKLNAEQAFVLSEISNAVRHNEYKGFLLHGVTGSGKTEVYIRAMQQALALDKGSLMLVPEIALTPIFSRRLRTAFGDQVAILHSSLSPGERFDEWRRIRSGKARIVIGTRSAIFAPIAHIGLIVIDEEHDSSYRQNESPFYNARDLAVMRANRANAVVVLGSATPSLESFHNAKAAKYQYLQLQQRIGGRPMATAELIDMRDVFKRAGKDVIISPQLVDAIRDTHAKGEQSIILLNRRGFSSFVLCRSCGETLRCINCDITLTYHRRENKVTCHYCNYSTPTPKVCPFCESEFLYFVGQGTEQIEAILEKQFPDLRIARIDRDTMKRKGEIDRMLLAFDRGEIDMLVGTQMLAKGHDFHNVTLVGVISVDAGLGMPDFRSAERTFQLLTQVAGRAGRGDLPGRVLIQTYHPEHYALRYAVEQNYEKFYDHEIRFRERMSYPPVVALASVLIRHQDLPTAQKQAAILKQALDAVNLEKQVRIIGPAMASISRIKNDYRLQIIIRSPSRKKLRETLDAALDQAAAIGGDLRRYNVEIDPLNLL